MTPEKWYAQNHHLFDSQFEHIFFDTVLIRIPGLDFSNLQAQMPFRDDDGKQRYCDFAIREGTEVRIAIEVDGYDKRGTGQGMSHDDFIDWQRRQAALTAQGWHVLRFANRDVCNEAGRCIRNVKSLLESLRKKEASRSAGSTPNKTSTTTKATNGSAHKALKAKTKKVQRQKKHAQRKLKKIGFSLGVLAIAFLGFHFYGQTWLESQLQSFLPVSAESPCPDAVPWSSIRNYMGQTVTTTGPVKRVTYKPDVNGSPTWIEVGARFPDPDRLTLLIWGEDRPAFESKISQPIVGDTACATGEVSEYRGDVQIQLKDIEQITLY